MSQKSLIFCMLLVTLGTRLPSLAHAAEPHHHEPNEASLMSTLPMHHEHMDAHMQWTDPRPPMHADQERAKDMVKTLRVALEKYKDHRVAIEDGYNPSLPPLPLPEYHFTNSWRGAKAAFRFDPAQPTSLLYKKTDDGYQLIGAMYTAAKRATVEDLHERAPLSVARWHAHVNICLPPKKRRQQADWRQFSPRGSITTKEECNRVGGRFHPQLFGWMVHVYPFEETLARI